MEMTTSCKDCSQIPKVQDAGKIRISGGSNWQVMFNGLEVKHLGYHGNWMSEIMLRLQGHHEPQEEFAFYQILQHLGPDSTMIELGCFWAYYSLWFAQQLTESRIVVSEPDPNHLELARSNFRKNGLFSRAQFFEGCAGFDQDYTILIESENEYREVNGISVKSLMDAASFDQLDMLHMDIQGAECEVLESLSADNITKRLRFIFVSTHHHLITGDPLTHERCLQHLKTLGAHIICEYTVEESFSGDGLIVASFQDIDSQLSIDVSRNRASTSLFRPIVYDLDEVNSLA